MARSHDAAGISHGWPAEAKRLINEAVTKARQAVQSQQAPLAVATVQHCAQILKELIASLLRQPAPYPSYFFRCLPATSIKACRHHITYDISPFSLISSELIIGISISKQLIAGLQMPAGESQSISPTSGLILKISGLISQTAENKGHPSKAVDDAFFFGY